MKKRILFAALSALALIAVGNWLMCLISDDFAAIGLIVATSEATGVIVLSSLLIHWPDPDPFDVDLTYPEAGDTHLHLSETEAACAVSPAQRLHLLQLDEPLFDAPSQRDDETHDDFRRRLAEHYALTFPPY